MQGHNATEEFLWETADGLNQPFSLIHTDILTRKQTADLRDD